MERAQFGGMAYVRQTTVLLGAATAVTEQGQSGSFSIADISVGQRIQASGKFSGSSEGNDGSGGNATLDASAGSVQMMLTNVAGTVTAASGNTVTLNLQSFDGRAAANFNFAGTGASAAQDASAGAYSVSVAGGAGGVIRWAPECLRSSPGLSTPFGAAPPGFQRADDRELRQCGGATVGALGLAVRRCHSVLGSHVRPRCSSARRRCRRPIRT